MSASQHATALGFHQNFFASIKKSCSARYQYIVNLNPNLTEAYRQYMSEQEQYKSQLTEIYYELSDKRKIRAFGRHLKDIGMYRNGNGFSTTITRALFRSTEGIGNHRFFIKAPKIIAEYHKVKESL